MYEKDYKSGKSCTESGLEIKFSNLEITVLERIYVPDKLSRLKLKIILFDMTRIFAYLHPKMHRS